MLNALSVSIAGADADGVRRAARSMERQGFVPAKKLPWGGGVVQGWGHPSQGDVPDSVVQVASGMACCVGPLWYRGRFGGAALGLLIDEAVAGTAIDEASLRGNYALFLQTARGCALMNDALGFVRIHTAPDGRFHSTSWLGACAYAGDPELDEGAAIEYVLLGASHSDRTAARGITTLSLGSVVDLEPGRVSARRDLRVDVTSPPTASLDDSVERISAHLGTSFREAAAAFPGRVRMALSGGFDSRLILAGLLSAGARPELFVYGDAASDDVRIAQSVAAGAHLALTEVDKASLDRGQPPVDVRRLTDNALFFDGLPTDGVMDAGSDRSTRMAQTASGWLAMNGGGGEIFRNFFHLPNRSFHPIDVVRAFYRGFDRTVFRRGDDFARYEEAMVASMQLVLSAVDGTHDRPAHGKLTRNEVELLYPLFRCHHWMGVNNSIAVRHGHYTTPLVDLAGVRLAAALPLAWKDAGLLESRLITRLDQAVAEQPSAYGFRFSDGPDARARAAERAMGLRPAFARPFINSVRRRLHGTRVAAARLADLRRLLPGEWRIDPILDLGRLPDEGALRRAASIEIAWREIIGK